MSRVTDRIANFSPERLRQLARRVNKKDTSVQQIPRKSRETNIFPVSFAQERLWFLDRLFPGNSAYNLPFALHFNFPENGNFVPELKDLVRLHGSTIDELVKRHEILRTSFPMRDGIPVQVVNPPAPAPPELILLADVPEGERAAAATRIILDRVGKPFDLAGPNQCRFGMIQLSPREYIGFAVFHHIVFDAWSHRVGVEEFRSLLLSALSGQAYRPPDLPIQYADYAAWQREWWQKDDVREGLSRYWKEQLKDLPMLNLPTDRPRPSAQSFRGCTESFLLSSECRNSLRQISQVQGVTLFATMLAAWAIVLQRYTGESDIAICVPVANRTRVETEVLIGFFVNTLVFRLDLSSDPTFTELQQRAWKVCTDAYAHQEMPFEQLVQDLQPARDLSRNPLSSISFQLQDIPTRGAGSGDAGFGPNMGLQVFDVGAQGSAFDLDFSLSEQWDSQWVERTKGIIRGKMTYSADLFDTDTIQRMLQHYQNVLRSIGESPHARISELEMLETAERRQVLAEWNQTQWQHAEQPIHELFEAQAAATPDAVALEYEDAQLSYGDLNRRVNQLAHFLRGLDVKREVRVGVLVERSLEMVTALLAVMKAGGVYVPLDPDYPAERLRFIAEDAGFPIVLTQTKLAGRLSATSIRTIEVDGHWHKIAKNPVSNPTPAAGKENGVYLIYTSGSTGKPKGVLNVHGGLSNRLLWMQRAYRLDSSDRVLQKTPFTFDVSVWEFFWPLITGSRLVLARPGGHQDRDYLSNAIQQYGITTVHFVPSMLAMWMGQEEAVKKCVSLKRVICSGEALNIEQQKAFYALLNVELHNLYGPTEASIDVTAWHCAKESNESSVPIGRPIDNTQVYVLDAALNPSPLGAIGQLYLAGSGLARGYACRPDLTAEVFVPNPFSATPGARMYRTGDAVRYKPDGSIEFLGRLDHQVKIRGFRIELTEIETILLQHPAIEHAVVVASGQGQNEKRLVAYLVRKQNLEVPELRAFLRQHLPEYMMPATFIDLDQIPVNANGKLDRKKLPEPTVATVAKDENFVAARTPTEQLLVEMWSRLLNVNRIGVDDNFFDLGGHSLLSLRLLDEVQQTFQIEISLRSLFDPPTVAAVAEKVETALAGNTVEVVEAPLDFEAEATLEATVVPCSEVSATASPGVVLLTGSTGFIGSFLLFELLQRTHANVYCLVRAASRHEGALRLRHQMESRNLWQPHFESRITAVCGDLSSRRLGLSVPQYDEIAEISDAIYHTGALVSFFYPYRVMKGANVSGTEEILRLACHKKQKPVHYVSSMGVFPQASILPPPGEHEWVMREDDLPGWRGLDMGYTQSKWVAERLVSAARDRNVPVVIYRPTITYGHADTGEGNNRDFLYRLIYSCGQLRCAPDIDSDLNLVPVDFVARGIVELSLEPSALGRVFHLVNPKSTSMKDIIDCIVSSGSIEKIPYEDWRTRLLQTPDSALAALARSFPEKNPDTLRDRRFHYENAVRLLRPKGIRCPEVGRSNLQKYVLKILDAAVLQAMGSGEKTGRPLLKV